MAHQATKLPTKAPETINNVTKLSDKAGYDRWAFLIKCSLITVDCEDLVDTSIPRPATPAPNDAGALLVYERWRKLSRTVMSWLVNQVDSHIIDELRQLPNIPQYADECFQAIKTIVVGQGHTELRSVWKRAVRMQRSQYGTIEQYVTAFRDAVQRANNLDLQITPWCAATLLLEELSKELPNWTAAVECAWPKDIHTKMKAQDWQQLCQDAIDRGRDYGSQMATLKKPRDSPLITSSPDSKKFPNDKNRDIKPTELGKPPPFGKNPDIYARELREKQLSFRRCCGHCGKEGHHTGICYHLMIKKPRFYEPNEEIWCYIAETKPQGDISTSPTPPPSSMQTTAIEMPESMRRFCGAAVAANLENAMKIASDLIDQIMPKMVDMIFESIEARFDDYVCQRIQTLSEPLERLEQRQAMQASQMQQAADIRPEVELEFARKDFQHHIDLLTSQPKPKAPVEPQFKSQRQEKIYDFDATDDSLLDSVPQDLEPPDPPTLERSRVTTTTNTVVVGCTHHTRQCTTQPHPNPTKLINFKLPQNGQRRSYPEGDC
jgi:hypothetical protein